MSNYEKCPECHCQIVGAPLPGAYRAHDRHCRPKLARHIAALASRQESNCRRPLSNLINVNDAALVHRPDTTRADSEGPENSGSRQGERHGSRHDESAEGFTLHFSHGTLPDGESTAGESDCSEHPDVLGYSDEVDEDANHLDDQPTFIEEDLDYDDIVAWLLIEFSNEQKKKIFLVMRILATLRGKGQEYDPFHCSIIQTIEAFEKYMDHHVDSFFCKMHASEVPVESTVTALQKIPGVPLFKRSLGEAIAGSFASSKIANESITLDPIPAPAAQSDEDARKWRVNSYMQGSNIIAAKQARVEHRLLNGGPAASSTRPIIGLCIFFDKTIISPMAKRELYPIFIAPMNVDASIRHEAIQLLCLVPNVKEWIHTHCPKGKGHLLTADIQAAVKATTTAVWQAMMSEISQATHPDEGVWINVAESRADILHHTTQVPVFDPDGSYIRVLCDLVVAALILDTPEAAATLGMVSRFGCNSKNTNAACLICHAPSNKYDCGPHELTAEERQLRDSEAMEALRKANRSAVLHQQGIKPDTPAMMGLLWDAQFPWGQLHRLWNYDHLHHWMLGTMKRLGCEQLKAIVGNLGSRRGHTIKAMTNRVNRGYDEMTVFSVPPFPRLPYGCLGGIIGQGDGVGQGKLQATELKRVQGVLSYIVDELPGACLTTAPIALARRDSSHIPQHELITVLGLLLMRDNTPHAGWTLEEAERLQRHICFVWLPLMQIYLSEMYSPEEMHLQASVIKLHLLLCHLTNNLLAMGPLQEYTTSPYETAHKQQKRIARATNCTKAKFAEQHAKRASQAQSLQLAGFVKPALGAVMRGDVTVSSIVTVTRADGAGERQRILLPLRKPEAVASAELEVYPVTLDPVSAANRSEAGSSHGTRLFNVVLRAMAETQAAEGPQEATCGHPCATIRAAAGLLGEGPEHRQCNYIRQRALSLVRACVTQDIHDVMARGITASNVQNTAEQVLRMPELLAIPSSMKEYLTGVSSDQLQPTGGLEQTLLRLCFVSSNKVRLTYYNLGDVEQVHRRQVTCLNRATHLNFFLTDRFHGTQPMTYAEKLDGMLAGTCPLSPRYWVYLMCTGLTMMVAMDRGEAQAYVPLRVCDASEDPTSATAQVCLTRWLHRVHAPGDRKGSAVAEVMQAADPHAEHFGCDRLVWARRTEGERPDDWATLSKRVTNAAAAMKSQRSIRKKKVKRDESTEQIMEGCVTRAREAVHSFGRDRYRDDDAFRGIAYCSIMSPKVMATPVRVVPVLRTERSDQWSPGSATSETAKRFSKFSATQGYKLGSYYQLRLDLHAVPLGIDDD